MTPEQSKAILISVEELEAWAGGLLEKCTKTKKLIQHAAPVSTGSKGRQPVLTKQQLADISAKRRMRILK